MLSRLRGLRFEISSKPERLYEMLSEWNYRGLIDEIRNRAAGALKSFILCYNDRDTVIMTDIGHRARTVSDRPADAPF
jgi:hypothetical protein